MGWGAAGLEGVPERWLWVGGGRVSTGWWAVDAQRRQACDGATAALHLMVCAGQQLRAGRTRSELFAMQSTWCSVRRRRRPSCTRHNCVLREASEGGGDSAGQPECCAGLVLRLDGNGGARLQGPQGATTRAGRPRRVGRRLGGRVVLDAAAGRKICPLREVASLLRRLEQLQGGLPLELATEVGPPPPGRSGTGCCGLAVPGPPRNALRWASVLSNLLVTRPVCL